MVIKHDPPPRYEELLPEGGEIDFWRWRDEQENEESTPPLAESIGRPCIQVAECFVGGDVQGLVEGCRALGINAESRMAAGQDLFGWVEQVQRTSRAGGWLYIGAGHRRDIERKWMDDVPLDLPEDFDRVILKAFSPTPSLVFLVGTFILRAESALGLDDQLRTNRYLRLEKRGRMTAYVSATHRKIEEVRLERSRVVESASAWVAQSFAGTFARDFGLAALPGIEFLTTTLTEPLRDSHMSGLARMNHYTHILSIDRNFDSWESAETPGWRFAQPWHASDVSWTMVAACRLSEVDADEPSMPKPHPNEIHRLAETFDGFVIRWAASCLLVQYEGSLGALRDQLASAQTQRRALDVLDATHTTLTTVSFDASLVATELQQWASDDFRWRDESIEPITADGWRQGGEEKYPPLLQILAENVVDRSRWILDLEPRIRDQLVSRTSILAISTDLRLQRIVLTVSLVALVVACISLVIS
ncbi:hypothetical protein V6K52_07080 [Knoellia sp. S7-12]|uniref:hypothetical protein n=1 Tax=Knoellia sp. S7-12 TaxID=3126698 RepID=UPI0033663F07